MTDEFSIIERFFGRATQSQYGVCLPIGDDAALLQVQEECHLVAAVDTMVAGVHFLPEVEPRSLGHKALAVNLSDMAAMGAKPRWFTLSLTLPQLDTVWLESFSAGMIGLADQYEVALVGGDTSKGPLSVSVQIMGEVPRTKAILRSGAQVGDLIYVTGQLGDAGLALLALQGELQLIKQDLAQVLQRLQQPTPRVEVGLQLRDIAHAAIDISDGLAADLGHILNASKVGATLWVEQLPISSVVRKHLVQAGGWSLPLTAGDDYELCFCVAEQDQGLLEQALHNCAVPYTWVGVVDKSAGLRCLTDDGLDITPSTAGYRHF